jgi:hypothetical protein
VQSTPLAEATVGVVAASDVVRTRECKQARGKVKRAGNSLFSTIQVLKYRGNRSYERGRDANGGEGVKSEVERQGLDR